MAYDWLTIVESRRLGDGSVFNDAEIKEWRDFAAAFITGFTLVSDTEYYIRVDGFRFFMNY